MKIYTINGMHCAACAANVERAAKRLSGVQSAEVSLLTAEMTVTGDFDEGAIIAAVSALGFSIQPKMADQPQPTGKQAHGASSVLWRLVWSLSLLLPLMYLAMGGMIGLPQPTGLIGLRVSVSVQAALTLAILSINNGFFVSAAKSLRARAFNMDTLVSLGSLASLGVGIASLIGIMQAADLKQAEGWLEMLYFDSSAMIVTLVTVGKLLEAQSKRKTTSALDALTALRPVTVRVLRDGEEVMLPISELKKGDIFITKAGESFAADGRVLSGIGAVNEAAITGESLPRDIREGDSVTGATVLSEGFIRAVAERVGSETVLSAIIESVRRASASKAPVARLADKISGIFVPCVLAIAAITMLVWLIITGFDWAESVMFAASVLVISCPCALGLATPVAITVSVGKCAKEGILVKSAAVVERAAAINAVVFDKTGTITRGQLRVTEVRGDTSHLKRVAAIERLSSHPISAAIAEYCGEPDSSAASDFSQFYGGISGSADGIQYTIGSAALMKERDIVIDGLSGASEGTVIYAETGGKAVLAFAIADSMREDSAAAAERLRSEGIFTALATGDGRAAAEYAAQAAGIAEYRYSMRPEQKAEYVRELCERGYTVAFVGDGINDAPALAAADIGVAAHGGTDVAIGAADVAFMREGMMVTTRLISVAKRTLRIIKQNLFWAFLYNVLCIPIAAGVFSALGLVITPMIGAAAMSLSSVMVVLNSLRI